MCSVSSFIYVPFPQFTESKAYILQMVQLTGKCNI